jgi:hypothetical protein
VQEDGRSKRRLAGEHTRDRIQIGTDDCGMAVDIADLSKPFVG